MPCTDADTLVAESVQFAQSGDFESAAQASKSALELGSTAEEAFYTRAFSLRKLRLYGEAVDALVAGLAQHPTAQRLLNENGILRAEQGHYEEAIKGLEATLAIDSDNEDALNWRIDCLRRLRRFDETRKAIDEALGRLPNNARILNQRGWLHSVQSQYEEAIK